MGNNQDPVTLHKYLYANSDPVNGIDPSGNMTMLGLSISNKTMAILAGTAATTYAIGQSLATDWDNAGAGLRNIQSGWLAIAGMLGESSKPFILLKSKVREREGDGGSETLYHGTTANAASKIMRKGFRSTPVYFAEDPGTARMFGQIRASMTGAQRVRVLTFDIPRPILKAIGLHRGPIGEDVGLPFVDTPGSTGYERILNNSVGLQVFNGALKTGAIQVR